MGTILLTAAGILRPG